MINFLSEPEDFRYQIRAASLKEPSLAKIARVQLKYAKSFQKLGFWLINSIKSGVIWVKGILTRFANTFHKMTKALFFSAPVLSTLTKYFRKIAYRRLLGAMYDSWKLGLVDSTKKMKRTPSGVLKYLKSKASQEFKDGFVKSTASFYSREPFYDEYLLGYEGKSQQELTKRAKMVVERDIGTRTMSELCKFIFDSGNVFTTILQFTKEMFGSEAYTGRSLWKGQGTGKVVQKNSRTGMDFFIKLLLQSAIWLFLMSTKTAVFALYGMIPLGLVGLFYYSPGEALFKKSVAMKDLSSLFKTKSFKKEFTEILEKQIPIKSVFIRDSLGSIENPTAEDLENIKREYND